MSEVRLGIDVACRADHRASLADERGEFIWSSWKFRTTTADLERLWAKIPDDAAVTVILEPTRNAWVPLSAWLQSRGATVILVPPEQSADLRDYYNKHTKTDRLDSRVLARLPLLHPEGLRGIDNLGPAESLRRAVRHRFSLVKRRSAASLRLDALVELLGPGWADALGSATASKTALVILEKYADPRALKRLGRARLAALLIRSSAGLWREDKAAELLAMANETLALWSCGGIDFTELAHDIASEVRVLRRLDDEITGADKRIAALYDEADPKGIVASGPGLGPVLSAAILGNAGDFNRFANLAGVRSFTGFVPTLKAREYAAKFGPHRGASPMRYSWVRSSSRDFTSSSSTNSACGCRECHPSSSRCEFVLMDETTKLVGSSQPPCIRRRHRRCRGHRHRRHLTQRPMWPVFVVVDDVVGQDLFQMPAAQNQHPVEAFATNGADEAFGEGVGSRCPHRGADDPAAV